jgi:glutathione S-transferase
VQLYFAPLACSIATRVALYEAGASATFTEVDSKTKRTLEGDDFRQVHPLGLVPVLRTDDGELLSENAAVLQYVAERFPEANLAPTDPRGRARLHEWLCYIGTELHKGIFALLLDPKAPDEARAYAIDKSASRLDHVERHLTGRDFLLDHFTVADAYLAIVLTWTRVTPIDLSDRPALTAYLDRVRARPAFARALAEESALYMEEQRRHRAA